MRNLGCLALGIGNGTLVLLNLASRKLPTLGSPCMFIVLPATPQQCASLLLTASSSRFAFFLVQKYNYVAMSQNHVILPCYEPQPCLTSLLFSGIFLHSTHFARTIELTMLHLQKFNWTSKTPSARKHQPDKQPHGLGTLLSRG